MRSLLDTGALVRENGDWRLDREVEVEVPDTVERLVLSRIDRLDGPCHDVLAAAAVLGRQFELSVLERIAGEGDIAGALRELQRLELVRQGRRWPVPEYRFRHSLIQEAATAPCCAGAGGSSMPVPPPPSPSCTPTGSTSAPACSRATTARRGTSSRPSDFHRRAADAALRIYAQEEALEHLDGALAAAAALGRGPDDRGASAPALRARCGALRQPRRLPRRAGGLGHRPAHGARGRRPRAGGRHPHGDSRGSARGRLRGRDTHPAGDARRRPRLRQPGAGGRGAGAPEHRLLERVAPRRRSRHRLRGHGHRRGHGGPDTPRRRARRAQARGAHARAILPRLDALCRELVDLLSGLPDRASAALRWTVYCASFLPSGFVRSGRSGMDEALARSSRVWPCCARPALTTHGDECLETLARFGEPGRCGGGARDRRRSRRAGA